jgi:hypothetical protein
MHFSDKTARLIICQFNKKPASRATEAFVNEKFTIIYPNRNPVSVKARIVMG